VFPVSWATGNSHPLESVPLCAGRWQEEVVIHRSGFRYSALGLTGNGSSYSGNLGDSYGRAPEQMAQGLSALLARSAADRDSIVNAVDGVNQCAPDLGQDLRTFQSAAASRFTVTNHVEWNNKDEHVYFLRI
jgi:hypothetical protein